jgi:hypothetical protein
MLRGVVLFYDGRTLATLSCMLHQVEGFLLINLIVPALLKRLEQLVSTAF